MTLRQVSYGWLTGWLWGQEGLALREASRSTFQAVLPAGSALAPDMGGAGPTASASLMGRDLRLGERLPRMGYGARRELKEPTHSLSSPSPQVASPAPWHLLGSTHHGIPGGGHCTMDALRYHPSWAELAVPSAPLEVWVWKAFPEHPHALWGRRGASGASMWTGGGKQEPKPGRT